MGIESTIYITRDEAISRIELIEGLIREKNYREVENLTCEDSLDLQNFIDDHVHIDISKLEGWTDRMLEKCMDKPGIRHSMFNNYLIGEDQ